MQGSAESLLPVVQPMKKQEDWAEGSQVRVLDGVDGTASFVRPQGNVTPSIIAPSRPCSSHSVRVNTPWDYGSVAEVHTSGRSRPDLPS